MTRTESKTKTGGGNALREVEERYASLIEACEFGSESGAEEVLKIAAERDALLAEKRSTIEKLQSVEKYLAAVVADDDLELDPVFALDNLRELLRDIQPKGGAR
jgi:hypothetical protein